MNQYFLPQAPCIYFPSCGTAECTVHTYFSRTQPLKGTTEQGKGKEEEETEKPNHVGKRERERVEILTA